MSVACRFTLPTVTLSLALLAGCGHKLDANQEMQKAATELAKAPPTATPAPAPAPTPEAQPNQPAAAETATAVAPSVQMNQAMTAYKAGNLEDAVTRLQKLRATAAITPQQRIALNDAMAAVMSEIYAMAAKGDGRAVAAVKQYEFLQTHRQ